MHPDGADEGEQDDDGRQREQQFGEPAEAVLHPAAVLGGKQSQRDADAEGDDDREQR